MTTILTSNTTEPLLAGNLILSVGNLRKDADEIGKLSIEHHREVASDGKEYGPNWIVLEELERVGAFILYVARNAETNEMAGYVGYFVSMSLHYYECKQAMAHGLYLSPQYRKGRNAMHLIQYSEIDLKGRGVQFVNQAVTTRNDYSKLVNRLGYTETETIYVKRLGA